MTKAELIKKWQSDLQTYCSEDVYTLNQLEVLFGCLVRRHVFRAVRGRRGFFAGHGETFGRPHQGPRRPQPEDRGKAPYSRSLRVTFKPSKAFRELLN